MNSLLHVLDSFFLLAALLGSLGLYIHCFLKRSSSRLYCFIALIYALIMGVLTLFSVLNLITGIAPLILMWFLGGIHCLSYALNTSQHRAQNIALSVVYLLLPLSTIISQYLLTKTGVVSAFVYDELLMAVDGTLGFYPSLLIGRFLYSLPQSVIDVLHLIYLILPAAFIFIYIKQQHLALKTQYGFIIEFFLIGIIGFFMYYIVPACGTLMFDDTWPYHLLSHQFIQDSPQIRYCPEELSRGCIPSLHIAWAISLLRRAQLCDAFTKSSALLFTLGTLLAVFGIGMHYFIDVVVGFAFATCMGGGTSLQLSWHDASRWQAFVFGGLICVTWYILILFGLPLLQLSALMSWCSVVFSLLLCLYLERNLTKAQSLGAILPVEQAQLIANTEKKEAFI